MKKKLQLFQNYLWRFLFRFCSNGCEFFVVNKQKLQQPKQHKSSKNTVIIIITLCLKYLMSMCDIYKDKKPASVKMFNCSEQIVHWKICGLSADSLSIHWENPSIIRGFYQCTVLVNAISRGTNGIESTKLINCKKKLL